MENEQLINEQLGKLPKKLRETLESMPWKASVKTIASTSKLSLDQSNALEQETMLVLYGFEPPADFPDNLARELGIDADTAVTLAEEVNEKIFKEIDKTLGNIEGTTYHNLPMLEAGEAAHAVPHDTKLDSMPASTSASLGGPKPTPVLAKSAPMPAQPPQPQAAPAPASTPKPAPTPAPVPTVATPAKPPVSTPINSSKTKPSDSTPVEKPAKVDLAAPDYRYPGGKDPYREPLE
jgi:hypothetical protein